MVEINKGIHAQQHSKRIEMRTLEDMKDIANKYMSHEDRNVRDLAMFTYHKILDELGKKCQ